MEDPYEVAFRMNPVGTSFVSLDREVLLTNPAMWRILGRTEEEIRRLGITALTHPDDREIHLDVHQKLMSGDIDHYELQKRYLRPDGSIIWAHLVVSAVFDDNGSPLSLVSQLHDITEQVRANDRLNWLATHDALTGLLNRRGIYEALEEAASVSGTSDRVPFGVLMIGIDGFKAINEVHGHQVGDQLLTAFARRLNAALNPSAQIGRIGGDEFLVQLAGPVEASDLDTTAHLVRSVLSEPMILRHNLITPSVSIGAVTCVRAGPSELLQQLESSLSQAKLSGPGRLVFGAAR